VLIIVLVAIMLLSLAGYTFAQLMMAEREAAWAHGRALQARALADSGVAWVEQQLAQSGAINQAGGWYDNPALFRGIVVAEDTVDRDRGRFSVLAPRMQYSMINGARFGLEDESARLNLNTLLLSDQIWQQMAASAVASANSQSGGNSQASGNAQSSASAQTAASAQTSASAQSASSSGAMQGSGGSQAGGSSQSSTATPGSAQAALQNLPGMTPQIIDAILDWLDPDDIARPNGAEREYYAGLSPPYAPKNGPFETVEELLLVKGITPQLLYGMDIDRNSFIDSRESQSGMMAASTSPGNASASNSGTASNTSSSSSSSGSGISGLSTSNLSGGAASTSAASMSHGWAAYLTVYSHESNLQTNGQPRINVNAINLEQLYQAVSSVLGPQVATFVVAYRQGSVVTGSQTSASSSGKTPDFTKPGNTLLASPLDLVGCKVSVTFQGDQQATIISSPFDGTPQAMASYIPMLLETLTIVPSATVPGRININDAPLPVLMAIPGMDSTTANMIVSAQQSGSSQLGSNRNFPTWLFTEGLTTLDTVKKLMPFITCTGRVYRAQVVGFYDGIGPVSRVEVVVDATTAAPRLLLWRDLSHLGRGYSPQFLGAAGSGKQ
jgi:DNA uptake protein ComE-like DNA-binding protein